MWKRWKNNSRHCVVWLRLRISGRNAPQPCARRGLNATATRLDCIFLCVLKQPIALCLSALSRITETCLIESTRNCALRKSGQTTRQRMNSKPLKKMNASDLEVLLDGYIKSVVNKELHHAGVMADDGLVNRAPQENTTATKVVEAIADAKSKNGLSSGGGQGKGKGSSSKQNKGKGKGKGKKDWQRQEQEQEYEEQCQKQQKSVRWQRQGHEAQQELIPGVSKDSRKERRVHRHFERRAFCRRARVNERKNSRVSR